MKSLFRQPSFIPTFLMLCAASQGFAQGPLTPPGAPGPTMKTLDQVEPRTPLKNSGFPVTITSASTNFYLTENITLNVAPPISGITINANNVTIDLNGFALKGTGLNGIVCVANATNITITNGIVEGWKGSGIDLSLGNNSKVTGVMARNSGQLGVPGTGGIKVGDSSIVANCTSRGNAQAGITTGYFSVVSQCTASDNAEDSGILVGRSCTIDYCAANNNGLVGITADAASSISHCATQENVFGGINAGSGSAILGCTAAYNVGNGIVTQSGGTISSCSAIQNGSSGFFTGSGCAITGCSAFQNGTDGFYIQTASRLSNNLSTYNQGNGFYLNGGDSTIESNSAAHNTVNGFAVIVIGNFIVKNTASANTGGNYNILPGQLAGTIITGFQTIPNDPWANFGF